MSAVAASAVAESGVSVPVGRRWPQLAICGWYVLVFGAAWALAMVPIQRVVLREADRGVTADLEAEVDDLRAFVARSGVDPASSGATRAVLLDFIARRAPAADVLAVAVHDGEMVAMSAQPAARHLVTAERLADWSVVDDARWGSTNGSPEGYRWLVVPVGERAVFVVAADAGRERRAAHRQILVAGLAGAGALGLGARFGATRSAGHPRRRRREHAAASPAPVPVAPGAVVAADHTPRLDLRLLDAGELSEHLFAVLSADEPSGGWVLSSSATGDVVCDPDGIERVMRALAGVGGGRRLITTNHDGGLRFSVGNDEEDRTASRASSDIVGEVAAVVAAHDGRLWRELDAEGATVWSLFVPRRPQFGPIPGSSSQNRG